MRREDTDFDILGKRRGNSPGARRRARRNTRTFRSRRARSGLSRSAMIAATVLAVAAVAWLCTVYYLANLSG